MTTCSKCHNYYFETREHVCPPAWLVWNPENGDVEDARTFYNHDAEGAVQVWAERDDSDSADYLIVKGNPTIVCVQAKDGGPITKYRVTGEMEPHYRAEMIVE